MITIKVYVSAEVIGISTDLIFVVQVTMACSLSVTNLQVEDIMNVKTACIRHMII